MSHHIAFLRAINVGGHTVKMDRLRALFEELGLENVSTFIASGNVIFDSPEEDTTVLERRIEEHLLGALGYAVGTYIRDPEELAAIALHLPFSPEEVEGAGTLYVALLPSEPSPEVANSVSALSTPVDELRVHGRELYWLCRTRMSETEVNGAQLSRTLGVDSTMRNMNTVRRILAKVQ